MALSAGNTKRVATVEQSPLLPAPAAIVRFPKRGRQLDRLVAIAQEGVAIVLPPVIVLTLLLLIWQIAAAGPKATSAPDLRLIPRTTGSWCCARALASRAPRRSTPAPATTSKAASEKPRSQRSLAVITASGSARSIG